VFNILHYTPCAVHYQQQEQRVIRVIVCMHGDSLPVSPVSIRDTLETALTAEVQRHSPQDQKVINGYANAATGDKYIRSCHDKTPPWPEGVPYRDKLE